MNAVITVTPTDSEAYMLSNFYNISVLVLCFGMCLCNKFLCVSCVCCECVCVSTYMYAQMYIH